MASAAAPDAPAAPDTPDNTKPPATTPQPATTFQKKMAVTVLVFFAICSFVALWYALTVQDPIWLRIVFVYQGVQTIAFTAVGWAFGREVNRDGIQTMTELRDGAEQKADEAQADAAKQKTIIARIDGATQAHRAAAAQQADMVTLTRADAMNLLAAPDQATAPLITGAPETTLADVIQAIIKDSRPTPM